MIQTTLTKEQIESASRRDGPKHPVVSIFEKQKPKIDDFNNAYQTIKDGQERQAYIKTHFGFIGDALEEPTEFSLGPLDLVAIWSKALDIWPNSRYPRYELIGTLYSAYGIQGRPDLRGLSRYYIENDKLTDKLSGDKSGLLHVKDRSAHIHNSSNELTLYVYGTTRPMDRAIELIKGKDDENARKQLADLETYRKEHETPLLSEIRENSQGAIPFIFLLNDAIKRFE